MTIPTPGVPTPPVPGVPGSPGSAPEQGINWGELMKQAGEQLQPVPKGSYDCYVDTAEATQTSNGKLMYKLKLKIDGGPHNGRPLWNNITLTTDNPNALAMFFRNMDAFGLDMAYFATNPVPDAVAEALLGRRVRVVVDHRLWQGTVRENVKQIMKPQGVGVIAGVPVPGATTVPGPSAPVSGPPVPSAPVAPAPAVSPPQPATAPPPAPAPAPPAPEPVAIDLDAYRAAGWTDEQLIAAGHMAAPTPPPAREPEPEQPPTPDVPPPAPAAASPAGPPPMPGLPPPPPVQF